MYGLREEAVVCLDPGHADTPDNIDPDTGLNTRDWANSPEIEIVYDIASRARAILEANGVSVVMTKQSVDDPVDLETAGGHRQPGLGPPLSFTSILIRKSPVPLPSTPARLPITGSANSDTERTAYIDPAVQAASEYQAPVSPGDVRIPAEPCGDTRRRHGGGEPGAHRHRQLRAHFQLRYLEPRTHPDPGEQPRHSPTPTGRRWREAIAAGILAFLRNR